MKYLCDNCGRVWTQVVIPLVNCNHLNTRLEPGSTVPDGECPDCSAFIYKVKEKNDDEV